MLSIDSKPILPPLGRLAMVGLAVNAPVIGLCLLLGNVRAAVSLIGGYTLSIGIYALLHAILGRGLDLFKPDGGGRQSNAEAGVSAFWFSALMMGKYVVVAAFLFIAMRTQYLLVLPLLLGFVLSQISITWLSVTQSKKAASGR